MASTPGYNTSLVLHFPFDESQPVYLLYWLLKVVLNVCVKLRGNKEIHNKRRTSEQTDKKKEKWSG